jgi:hypothetical protein
MAELMPKGWAKPRHNMLAHESGRARIEIVTEEDGQRLRQPLFMGYIDGKPLLQQSWKASSKPVRATRFRTLDHAVKVVERELARRQRGEKALVQRGLA